jgi:hypothetical protein
LFLCFGLLERWYRNKVLALPAFDNRFSKEHATASEYLEHNDDLVYIEI